MDRSKLVIYCDQQIAHSKRCIAALKRKRNMRPSEQVMTAVLFDKDILAAQALRALAVEAEESDIALAIEIAKEKITQK